MITALPHRTHLVPSLLAGFLVAAGAADGAFRTKVAVINADQTVPAAISTADGCARVEVDTATNTLHYRIVFSGLSSAETAAHFHGPADIGATAGVLHTLPPGNPKVGTWNYDESIEADILAGRIYINIHSTTAPTGEIRGQLVDMISIITPAQTTPPSVSVGAGYGLFNIDTDADEVTYHIAFDGVLETVAHIHGFAMPTDGAGVLHPLPAGSPKAGTWSY
ncbi:MAG: CHRD domain-containing protein, partial [Phycisphaerae bacterium]|nr:CHRD domain-containing protein [Phycisphaerae bacterium]